MRTTRIGDAELATLGLVHDLQSPLATATSAFRVLETLLGQSHPETRFFRETVRSSLHSASTIARAWHAMLAHVHAPEAARVVDLHHLTTDVCKDLDILDVVTLEGLPRARIRPEKIRLVLHNLLDNARRYRGNAPLHISVGSTREATAHCIFVRDNGRGIPRKYQPTLFEPFRRVPPDTGVGLGVGLHLVQRIVRQHGGRVWVTSRARHGSTFFFTIPRDHPRSGSGRQRATPRAGPGRSCRVARRPC